MKRSDLKKKISDAYREETPDLRSRILSACEEEVQLPKETPTAQIEDRIERRPSFQPLFRRAAVAAICLMLFVSGISLGMFIPGTGTVALADTETVIYLDVNPSVELRVDGENKIVDVVAGNSDAKIVLSDLELVGIDANTALRAIVGSMYVNGYLREDSNSILVSVSSKNEETADSLLYNITEKINLIFENSDMKCAVIAQCLTVDDELIYSAEQYGVSVGKMNFLNKISNSFEGLTDEMLEEMSTLTINDLNLIYSQKQDSDEDNGHELISGSAAINITEEQALSNVLEQIEREENSVAESHVFLRPSKSGNARVAYGVNLQFRGDSTIYRYEVDTQSGEVYVILRFATLTGDGVVYRDVLFDIDAIESIDDIENIVNGK